MSSLLSRDEFMSTAEAASTVLKELGYKSCLVGSVACSLWGMKNRTPKDVDIVVLDSEVDLEGLKRSIVNRDHHFYLVGSKNRFATYKILWYRGTRAGAKYGLSMSCKVDLLKPGVLDIPSVPTKELYRAKNYDNMRVMPFVPLLFLKVQAWVHHGMSSKMYFRAKIPQDVVDIDELLIVAIRKGYKLKDEQSWLSVWNQMIGREHVGQYKKEHPSSAKSWVTIVGQ